MSSTDDRIVRMQFDNAKFKQEALATKTALGNVDSAIAAAGKNKGLLSVSQGMQQVAVNASKMQVVATTALATITSKAVSAGLNLAKSLAFSPIREGFTEYEALLTKQNTIMNATGLSARVVKGTLNELNEFSDQTIYNFGNMTDSLTKFVNAGISLPKATETIKGVANAAAFAGASAEEANRAMYAFSQSMSLGFVGLQDWNQIENANMGTIQFKNTLLEAAEAAGTLTRKGKGYVTESGKFVSATEGWRDGLKEQWATTEVLTDALSKYSDTSTKLGREAAKSATEVRTFTAFMGTLKESLASGWAKIFTSLFGNLNQATKFWTNLSSAIGGNINKFFDWLSTALKTWRAMGGFEKTLQGFKNILAPIGALFDVIGTAIRTAFPNSGEGSGKALYAMSAGFEAITRPLQWLADLIRLLTTPMTIFFQIIRIGGVAVKEVAGRIGDFVGGLLGLVDLDAPDAGGFLGWIKDLGSVVKDTLDQITKLLNKGKSLGEAFGSIDLPDLPGLPSLPSVSAPDTSGATEGVQEASASFGGLSIPLGGLAGILENIGQLFNWFGDTANQAGSDAASAGEVVGNALARIWEFFGKFFEGITFQDVIEGFNIAVLSTFVISVSRLMNTFSKSIGGFAGVGQSAVGVLDGVGNALNSFQTAARGKLIIAIAIAIGVLAAALWVLSKIPIKNLGTALVGLGAVFVMMHFAMKQMANVIEKMDQKGMSLKLVAFSLAIGALAASMLILATALLLFNFVDFSSIAKGLIIMVVTMKMMESLGNTGALAARNMIAGAAAIAIVSQSMLILAAALLAFKLVDWESIGKAGAVLGGLALAVGLLALIPYEGIAKVGLALLAASVGISMLSVALLIFSKVKWESIGKAAVVLGMLTLALAALMIVGNPIAISGLLGMAGAVLILSGAMVILNNVEWASIGKLALVFGVLTLALLAFTGVMYLMAPLVPVVALFGAALLALGLGLLAFSAAMAIAISLAAAGTAAFAALATGAAIAVAVFFQTLAAEAPILKDAFLDILQALIDTIVAAVPMIIRGIKDLWDAIVTEFTGGDKKKAMKMSFGEVMQKIVDAIREKLPVITRNAALLLLAFIRELGAWTAELAAAGAQLIVEVLKGIGKKAQAIADAAIDVVIKFAAGITSGILRLLEAGRDLIAGFLHGLADLIRSSSGVIGDGIKDVIDAMRDVGVDIVDGLTGGMASKMGDAIGTIKDIGEGIIGAGKGVLQIFSPSRVFKRIGEFLVEGLTLGIQNNAASAITAVASMVGGQIAVANEYINGFIQKLDQQSLAARAKAEGLAAAAERAAQLANKTKGKADDRAANALSKRAEKADKQAQQAEKKAERAKERQDRQEEFEEASLIEKAQMRSEDAQKELDAAKAAEQRAEKARVQAEALDRQSRAAGLTPEQRRQLQKEADALRAQAARDAKLANKNLEDARKAAADALKYQKLAGAEAAANFQEQFDADAREAAEQAEFERMTNAEKAALRRQQAAELQASSLKNLEEAKKLAYTDIAAANDLAALAMAEAERARQYLKEANDLGAAGAQGMGQALGTVVDLTPTEAAALGMNDYSDLYASASAAAAAGGGNTFNQYNTSPEALNPSEIYRQTNNLITFAVQRIEEAANP